ncbi:MAG: ABC transporter ATP-binding protein [Spirochaetales bacterium]
MGDSSEAILTFTDYSAGYLDDEGKTVNLLDKLSFTVRSGQALGVVGESGCGKSLTGLSAVRLLSRQIVVQGGAILLGDRNILEVSEKQMQEIRGRDIAMVFQEPMTSLNPVLSVGFQVEEVLARHRPELSEAQRKEQTISLLREVGIPAPEKRVQDYPHQFSGGMRQRVMIAMAIACGPSLLIADEPTTALDVTIQAQVLELMKKLKAKGALMLITHNLGIIADVCEEIIVMYAGRIVEKADVRSVFKNPLHPYTKGLIAAIPSLRGKKKSLYSIPGMVPAARNFPEGCRFNPRCEQRMEICAKAVPPLVEIQPGHSVACHLFQGGAR